MRSAQGGHTPVAFLLLSVRRAGFSCGRRAGAARCVGAALADRRRNAHPAACYSMTASRPIAKAGRGKMTPRACMGASADAGPASARIRAARVRGLACSLSRLAQARDRLARAAALAIGPQGRSVRRRHRRRLPAAHLAPASAARAGALVGRLPDGPLVEASRHAAQAHRPDLRHREDARVLSLSVADRPAAAGRPRSRRWMRPGRRRSASISSSIARPSRPRTRRCWPPCATPRRRWCWAPSARTRTHPAAAILPGRLSWRRSTARSATCISKARTTRR